MRTYKLLLRTVGIQLYVEADTLEELFKGALNGFADIVKKGSCDIKIETKSKVIKINSFDFTSLLVDFLSEVLQYSLEEGTIYCRVKILKIENKTLEAEIYGRIAEGGFDENIKGIKCSEAEIKKNEKGNWEVTILFDI
jgi:SHS2 domain-containing protein